MEESITKHDAVANIGIIGVPDETRWQILKAFVVHAASHEPTERLEQRLQEFVKYSLAKYEYPRNRVHRRIADNNDRKGPAA